MSRIELLTYDFSRELSLSLVEAENKVIFCSAFVKVEALAKLLGGMPSSINVTVVARWCMQDLIAGASDLSVYQFCKERGWKFGICQNFHGKLYVVDDSDIFLGSANLTQRGMSFEKIGNIEFGVKLDIESVNMQRFLRFLAEEVFWVTCEVYEKICEEIGSVDVKQASEFGLHWSPDLEQMLVNAVNFVWIAELPFSTPNAVLEFTGDGENRAHDVTLFGVDTKQASIEHLASCFRSSRVHAWIVSQLRARGRLNFGGVTAALHDSVLDDPKPYRKQVKEFVANLYDWLQILDDEFKFTKHRITTSVELKTKSKG